MDDKKIAFIVAVYNEDEYEKCAKYISCLVVPVGYTAEIITVMESNNIAEAYNKAMSSTDARYKIYLRETSLIYNVNIIADILSVFNQNPLVGMLGTAGTKKIPTNGICQSARLRTGKVINRDNRKVIIWSNLNQLDNDIEAVDGSIMITQYDIKWRTDLFEENDFFDVAQSIEFKRQGYLIGVVAQQNPWVSVECKVCINEKDRNVFLDEYSKDIFPLVSIMIPTYNRVGYFELALKSAIHQSYRNIEILIGDDSTNEDTKNIMRSYLKEYSNIRYFFNNGPMGGMGENNARQLFDKSKGEYVNFLMDDDVYHLDKISIMINYYLENPSVSLVTSYREAIDLNGQFLKEGTIMGKLCDTDCIIDGRTVGRELVIKGINFVGEPTTALVKKKYIDRDYGRYFGRKYGCVSDVTQWLESLKYGDLLYISKALSYFRVHQGQKQRMLYVNLQGVLERFYYIADSYVNTCYVYNRDEYKILLKEWLRLENGYRFCEKKELLKRDFGYREEIYQEFLKCMKMANEIVGNEI